MLRFILKRLLMIIPVLLGVIIITFVLSNFMPGDPVVNHLPSNYTQEQYDAKKAELGLDKPILERLVNYIIDIVTRFDLGDSYTSNRPVMTDIRSRIWVTLKLGIYSTLLTLILGIPIGIYSATHQYSPMDYVTTTISVFLAAIPGFWLALIAVIIFCLKLQWLPSSGLFTWKHYILPVICNGMMPLAITTRMTRSSMLEVVRQDYIRSARAKGVTERAVIVKHALKNALIPIITVAGTQLSIIVGGSIVIESIFSIPGMGALLVTAVNSRDYPEILGVTFIISIFVCFINLLVDITYCAVDPRIRDEFSSGTKTKKKEREDEKHTEMPAEGGV